MNLAENEAWTEPPLTLNHVDIKALVRHRDGYRCTECGMTATEHVLLYGRSLDVHRIIPGSQYTLAGCVSLCRECHKRKPISPKRAKPVGPLTVKLHPQLFAIAKAAAEESGESLASLVRQATRQFLKRLGLWPPKKP